MSDCVSFWIISSDEVRDQTHIDAAGLGPWIPKYCPEDLLLHVQRCILMWYICTLQIPGRFEVPVQMDSDIVMPCDSSQNWDWDSVQGKKQPTASEQMETGPASKEYQMNSPVNTLDVMSIRTLSTSTAPESLSARSMESDSLKIASRQSSAADLGQKLHLRLKCCDASSGNPECISDRSYESDVSIMLEDCFSDIQEFDTAMCSKISRVLLRKQSLMRAESFDWPTAPHKEDRINGFFQHYLSNIPEETRPLQKTKSLEKPSLDLSNMIAEFKMSSSRSHTCAFDDSLADRHSKSNNRSIRLGKSGAEGVIRSPVRPAIRHQTREHVDSIVMIPQ